MRSYPIISRVLVGKKNTLGRKKQHLQPVAPRNELDLLDQSYGRAGGAVELVGVRNERSDFRQRLVATVPQPLPAHEHLCNPCSDRRSDKQNGETLLRQGPPSDNPADGECQCQGSQYCTESPCGVQKAVAVPLSVFRVRQVPRARMIMAGN